MIIPMTCNELVLDERARSWCRNPYYNHPNGCPNFGVRKTCPPQAPLFPNYIDITKPMLLVLVGFKLNEHIKTMRIKHPGWTAHQLRCVLYWQNGVRAMLKREIIRALIMYPQMISTDCPEAMGVQVIDTAKYWFDDIKWIPEDIVYKIAICGSPHQADIGNE